jgi:diadenosine tetraphosphatase ApaH/serine/threonine PP2A family protein phosphatase
VLGRPRRILNPGSVGQPRDGNADASYAVLDFEAAVWEARRVAYDVADTQARMTKYELPDRLIARLAYGW